MAINTVTVLGANGTLGTYVSGIFASFGNAKVNMVSRDRAKSQVAAAKAAASVRADSIRPNLVPADYSDLPQCIKDSDLVFESVAEDLETKLFVTSIVAQNLKDDAIAASGTSGLSLTKLSSVFPDKLRGNYLGMHFYSPPYNLTLCELTPTEYTSTHLFQQAREYLSGTLFRTVVESTDTPAFIGNRIGFHFINKALQAAEAYKDSGGIDYIDAILGPFTGRSMAPLVTSDFVGLDVHKAIVDNVFENTDDYAHDVFMLPDFVQELVTDGRLGRKTAGGLYRRASGTNDAPRLMVYDISSRQYRDKIDYVFPFAEQMVEAFRQGDYKAAMNVLIHNRSAEAEICLDSLLEYIIYSLFVSKTVGRHIASADSVMATGFNWCPPLAMLDAISAVTDFSLLVQERLPQSIQDNVDIENLLADVISSKYDYRPFFKAKI